MPIAKPALALLAGAALVPLAACKVDNRPLISQLRGEPAPQYAALPQPGGPYDAAQPTAYGYPPPPPPPGGYGYRTPARRIAYEPARAWPYAERAYALDRAFYDIPPDYGFYWENEEPWVWEAADDSLMFAEPWGDAYSFYYYEPGVAWPYFIATPDYGYAFGPEGVLIAVFDVAGALLSYDDYDRYWPSAEQYWTRGLTLRQVYVSAPRYTVTEAAWGQRGPVISRYQSPWIRAGDTAPAWREWRARSGQDFVQRYAPDRQRRIASLSSRGFGGAQAFQGPRGGPQIGGGPRGAERQMRLAEARGPRAMRAGPEARYALPPARAEHGRGARAEAFRGPGRVERFQGGGRAERAQGPRLAERGQGPGRAERGPRFEARPFAAPEPGRSAVWRGPQGHGGGWRAEAGPPRGGGGGGPHGGGAPAQRLAQMQGGQPQPPGGPPQAHGNPHQGGGGGAPGGGGGGGGHGNGGGGGGPGNGGGKHGDHGRGR